MRYRLTMRMGLVLVTLCAAHLADPTWARADDSSVAEQLFRDGKRLIAEGKTDEACRAFEGSYRKQAATSTLLNLADCQERNGQYASAWASFVEAERMLRDDPNKAALLEVAAARAAGLEPRRSYLQINVPSAVVIPGLEVLRNDSLLDRAEWGARIAVDGGEYTIEVRAPGHQVWRTTVGVGTERDWRTVAVPALSVDNSAVPAPVGVSQPRSRSRKSSVGTWTMIGGGGLAVGAVIVGYLAKSKFDDAKLLCGDDLQCDTEAERATGQELVDSARFRGNVSTVIAGAAVAALGTGLVLWLVERRGATEPKRSGDEPAAFRVVPFLTSSAVGVAIGGVL